MGYFVDILDQYGWVDDGYTPRQNRRVYNYTPTGMKSHSKRNSLLLPSGGHSRWHLPGTWYFCAFLESCVRLYETYHTPPLIYDNVPYDDVERFRIALLAIHQKTSVPVVPNAQWEGIMKTIARMGGDYNKILLTLKCRPDWKAIYSEIEQEESEST